MDTSYPSRFIRTLPLGGKSKRCDEIGEPIGAVQHRSARGPCGDTAGALGRWT